MQPHRGILKDVVGVVPPPDLGKPGQHPPREQPQSLAADLDDPVAGHEIPRGQPLQAGGDLRVGGVVGLQGHGAPVGRRGTQNLLETGS